MLFVHLRLPESANARWLLEVLLPTLYASGTYSNEGIPTPQLSKCMHHKTSS